MEVKSLTRKVTLPAKYQRMMEELAVAERFAGKTVAIKMHLGGGLGYTTIHPLFVRLLTDKIKEGGGKPFITDGTSAVWDTSKRGYTEEVFGAKIIPAAGVTEKYYRTVEVDHTASNGARLEELHLCGNIIDADAMVVLSHFKGHGEASYGGAIKNIAMGAVTRNSRAALHRLEVGAFSWDGEKCIHCGRCIENCPTGSCTENEDGEIEINVHNCVYCKHCAKSCPTGAIEVDADSYKRLQEGLAVSAREVRQFFDPGEIVYFNLALDITPLCDCWGMTTQPLVPDVGIFGSLHILPVDKAALDHINMEDFIEGSLPAGRELADRSGHLFERVWGTDPYYQIRAAEELGLGESEYEIERVD
ncbi:MAG: DUF362 domain-containing protein [Planctomycetota bacterium]